MPFEKGNKLSGGKGRPKGSPNKRTQEVRDLLEFNKIPLVQRALDLSLCKDVSKTDRHMLGKLLDKLIPTLQAVEHSGGIEHSELTRKERKARIKELTAKLVK